MVERKWFCIRGKTFFAKNDDLLAARCANSPVKEVRRKQFKKYESPNAYPISCTEKEEMENGSCEVCNKVVSILMGFGHFFPSTMMM